MSSVVKIGTGRIKLIGGGGTFAFVACDDDSPDVFVGHATIIESGIALQRGDHVSFSAVVAPKGLRATSLKLVD
jgi:cold shock CspA family protein